MLLILYFSMKFFLEGFGNFWHRKVTLKPQNRKISNLNFKLYIDVTKPLLFTIQISYKLWFDVEVAEQFLNGIYHLCLLVNKLDHEVVLSSIKSELRIFTYTITYVIKTTNNALVSKHLKQFVKSHCYQISKKSSKNWNIIMLAVIPQVWGFIIRMASTNIFHHLKYLYILLQWNPDIFENIWLTLIFHSVLEYI